MKNIDIGFEKFEEDFTADLNTMYIKPEKIDSSRVVQIVKPSSKQRSKLYERLSKNDNIAKVSINDNYIKGLRIKRGK